MGLQPGRATNDPLNYIAIGKQTAKGTEASTFHFPKYLDGSGFDSQVDVQREREGGDGQEVGLVYISMIKADGALAAYSRSQWHARAMAGVMGVDSVGSAAVPSLARHTAVLGASLPYFTVDQRWADTVERSVDNVFTGVTIEGEAGKPWKTTANFLSGGTTYQRDVASALTPTREQGRPHFYPAGSYVFDGAGSYSADVTKIKVEIQRNVDDGIQTTGLTRDDVVPLNFDATFDATLKYTSRAFYQKIVFTGGSVVLSDVATGSLDLVQLQQVQVASGVFATGMMRLQAPVITWTDAKVNKLDPDGKTVYLDVVGMTVKGPSSPIIATTDTLDTSAY